MLDYSEDGTEIYRIGKTDDLKKRKQIYDTHTLHKKNSALCKNFESIKAGIVSQSNVV